MSHPVALITDIRNKVASDYPPDQFSFAIEKAIPGTRMFPDLLITDRSGKMVCAVEIGYTRPEKLTAYRELGIADVRWYDKQGNLHSGWEIHNVRAVVEVAGAEPTQVAVYKIPNQATCPNCLEDLFGCLYSDAKDCHHEECVENADYEARAGTYLIIVTDYLRAWLPCFCDQCGDSFLCDEDAAPGITLDLESLTPAEFGLEHGRREMADWHVACEFVEQVTGMQLSPFDYLSIGEDVPISQIVRRKYGNTISIVEAA